MTAPRRQSAFWLTSVRPWCLIVAIGCNPPSSDGLFGPGGEMIAGGSAGDDGLGGTGGSSGAGGAAPGGAAGAGGSPAAGTGGVVELDAGEAVSDAAVDAGQDAALVPEAGPSCSGVSMFEICWHLGAIGANCEQTCSSLGGYDIAATAVIGTPAQGGNIDNCLALLEALDGTQDSVISGTQQPAFGVGCHTFDAEDGYWWWLTAPAFSPSASLAGAQVVCGCNG